MATPALPTKPPIADRRSVTEAMAEKYGMMPAAFEKTVRAICMRPRTGDPEFSAEEFAGFLIICRNYELNPILGEIYAFRRKGGGFQAVVGVDGWSTLINRNPQLDGISFEDHFDAEGNLFAISCQMHRKDRTHPIEITEYMAECVRSTEPWKQWPKRFLRHKALIQCARYAFGFAGIVDPDEAERIIELEHGQEPTRQVSQRKPSIEVPAELEETHEQITQVTEDRIRGDWPADPARPLNRAPVPINPEDFLANLKEQLSTLTADDFNDGGRWDQIGDVLERRKGDLFPDDYKEAGRLMGVAYTNRPFKQATQGAPTDDRE